MTYNQFALYMTCNFHQTGEGYSQPQPRTKVRRKPEILLVPQTSESAAVTTEAQNDGTHPSGSTRKGLRRRPSARKPRQQLAVD